MSIKTEILTFGHSNSNELTNHFNPSRPDPGRREKINLHFYFHTFFVAPPKGSGLHRSFLRHKKEV